MAIGYHTGQCRSRVTTRIWELAGWLVTFTKVENTRIGRGDHELRLDKLCFRLRYLQDSQLATSQVVDIQAGSRQFVDWQPSYSQTIIPSLPEQSLGLCLSCFFLSPFSLPKSCLRLRLETSLITKRKCPLCPLWHIVNNLKQGLGLTHLIS